MPTPIEEADHFINNEVQFHLGYLITEQSHPKTRGLSDVLQSDTAAGLRMLQSVDDDIPPVVRSTFTSEPFTKLTDDIESTLRSGGRIHFSGCGATGRLAILLDSSCRKFWRNVAELFENLAETSEKYIDKTNAVMTGGDFALIRSVESFEDYIAFGSRQLTDAGFTKNDMLVAISEGGETSSVIGTIHAALALDAKVSFLFNNPSELMIEKVERSRKVIQDPRVNVVNLTTGPMGIAGSTRMQATSIELIVAAAAYETAIKRILDSSLSGMQRYILGMSLDPVEDYPELIESLLAMLKKDTNVQTMAEYTDFEAQLYEQGGRVTYFADEYMLDIFTDTTERSPTFKIPPFRSERERDQFPAPWAMVKDPMNSTADAWQAMLETQPRCIEWTEDDYRQMDAAQKIIDNPSIIDQSYLYSFPIGNDLDYSRTEAHPNAAVAVLVKTEMFNLQDEGDEWHQAFRKSAREFDKRKALLIGSIQDENLGSWEKDAFRINGYFDATPLQLFDHLAVKLVMNNISTATMGKLGRLSSNWMAHVDASNKKLIDRSVRLISELAEVDYRTACITLFESLKEMETWPETRRKTISPAAWSVEKLKKTLPNV